MAKNDLNGPVCLNHPNQLAVAHCCVCRRPICQECLVERNGFKCCSEAHLKQAEESTQHSAGVLEGRKKYEKKRSGRSFFTWVILIAILAIAWIFRNNILALIHK